MCAEFSGKRGLCSCNRLELAHFAARSLHRKFPFLTRVSETGSMTGRGVDIFGRLMALKQLGHSRRRHRPIKVMPAILCQEFAEPK